MRDYYDISDDNGVSTRLLTIQPWALMVNTTGRSISFYSHVVHKTILGVANMSVIVPPITFYEVYAAFDIIKIT